MKPKDLLGWSSALCLAALAAQAQPANEVEQLKRQLQQMQENFEKVQREQRQQIDALTKKLEELSKQQTAEAEKKKLEEQLAAELTKNQPAPPSPAPPASTAWSPAQPLTLARAGSAYMNISFDALMDFGWSTASDPPAFLHLGEPDPITRAFSLRSEKPRLMGS